MQPTTDDASHDEALSSRIAALNMLDLGLGHLGIEVPRTVDEAALNAVVKECGDRASSSSSPNIPLKNVSLSVLSQLDDCHSPAEKSALLVSAHKAVVGKFTYFKVIDPTLNELVLTRWSVKVTPYPSYF